MKVRIPAQTVNVNPDAWAHEYGIDRAGVREDVMAYFANIAQDQIDALGLAARDKLKSAISDDFLNAK